MSLSLYQSFLPERKSLTVYLRMKMGDTHYTSYQESDQRVSDWRKMSIDGILYHMKHGNAHDLFFGLKALPAWLWSGLTD